MALGLLPQFGRKPFSALQPSYKYKNVKSWRSPTGFFEEATGKVGLARISDQHKRDPGDRIKDAAGAHFGHQHQLRFLEGLGF